MTPQKQISNLFAEHYPEYTEQADVMGDLVIHAVTQSFEALKRVVANAPTPELAFLGQLTGYQLVAQTAMQELDNFKKLHEGDEIAR
jgi:hypothetical protein